MPITHYIDPEKHLLRMELSGTLSLAEMRAAAESGLAAIQADPSSAAGYSVLSDHRGVATPATPEQMQGLVTHLGTVPRGMLPRKWAIVTTNDASYGMMRMLMVLAERIPLAVNVFREMEPALKWIEE